MIRSTMQRVPLSSNTLLERAGKIYPQSEVVSRMPDKSLHRYRFADFYRRSRQLASALLAAGLKKGDRVATLSWNHYAHFECYFGIPAAGGVLHTLNLRLAPDEIAWIAQSRRGSLRHRRRLPAAAVREVQGPGEVREDHRRAAHRRAGARRRSSTTRSSSPTRPAASSIRSTTKMIRSRCATPPARPAVPKASCTRIARWCCTRWSAVCPITGISRSKDSVLPVTPMFHANCWGIPYGAAMMGIKQVFPGPHLGAADLIDLFMREKPTYSLGVPTIWISILQLLDSEPERYRLPPGVRMIVGGSAVPESLIRGFARHGVSVLQGWGMTETSPLASGAFVKPELQHLDEEQRYRARERPLVCPRRSSICASSAMATKSSRGTARASARSRCAGTSSPAAITTCRSEPDKFTADGWLRTGDVATRRRARLHPHRRSHQGPDQVRRRVDQLGRHGERADGRTRRWRKPQSSPCRTKNGASGRSPVSCSVRARPRRPKSCARTSRTSSRSGSCRSASNSSTRSRAPRPASSGRRSCATSFE